MLFLICECLIGVLIYLLLEGGRYWQTGRLSKQSFLVIAMFCLYLTLLYSLTGLATAYSISLFYQGDWWTYVNLIPFSQTVNVREYLLNILLFTPLGLLVPWAWEDYRSLKKTVCFGFSLSLFIEVVQLLNHRISDIDDLLMNVLGVVLGYGVYRLLARYVKLSHFQPCFSPYIYLFALYLGRFFLFNESVLWRLFY